MELLSCSVGLGNLCFTVEYELQRNRAVVIAFANSLCDLPQAIIQPSEHQIYTSIKGRRCDQSPPEAAQTLCAFESKANSESTAATQPSISALCSTHVIHQAHALDYRGASQWVSDGFPLRSFSAHLPVNALMFLPQM